MDRHEDIVAEREVIEDVLRGFRDTLDAHLDSHPPYVQQMLKYIHDHLFDSTLAIEEVKKACRLSNNNITTKFRHSVGLGTREYIRSQRLKVAAAILHKMDVNIYLVADAVGYTEEAFSKLFKKEYGEPPLHYRQKVLREMDKKNGQEKILRKMVKSL